MNKTKIAIIDSGIDINNSYLLRHVKSGKSFILDSASGEVIEKNDIEDNHGHGTACTYTILRRNENVEIIPIKILDESEKTSSKCLLEALRFLAKTDVKLINISLSTINFDYKNEFFKICDKLVLEKKIIVASMDNRYINSLPSILPNVIGVRGKNLSFTDDYWYNPEKDIQCICDNEPILVPSIRNGKLEFFGHNSKAAAVMSANISKLLNIDNNLTFFQLNHLLYKGAIKNDWTDEDLRDIRLEKHMVESKSLKKDLKQKADVLCNLIIDTYDSSIEDISFIYKHSLFNNFTKMNKQNFYYLIYAIENEFNIRLNYDRISLKAFDSIYSLLDIVLKSE